MAYPPAQSPAMAAPQQDQDLPMSATEVREWWARVELDRQRRKRESEQWRRFFRGYLPPTSGGNPVEVNSNIHFRNAHLKIAEVWAQLPELVLSPLQPLYDLQTPAPPPMPGMQPPPPAPATPEQADKIVSTKRAVLNKMLGRDHANVDLTIEQALFDVFATSGVAATKICYQADTQPLPQDAATEPTPQPGAILGLGTPPTPAPVPVVVNERWRWYRFSAEKLGIPADFHSTDYDEAPYLFMEFVEELNNKARQEYNLPPGFTGNVSRDELIISRDQDQTNPAAAKLLKGVEVWLYASRFDPTVGHSQVMRRLVLIEGMKDKAAIYRPSPYQTIEPDGSLSPDSMIGNPIHPITLRVASDTAWIPSDAAFTDPLVRVENTWMSQDLKMRDANLPRFLHSDKITAAVDKLKNMDTGQGASIAHDLMMQGTDRLIAEIPHLEHAQSDTEGRQSNQRAITETLGISPNQAGGYSNTVRSATEVATVQANVSVRLKKEQNNLLNRFLAGVRKFDALLQRYMTEPGYIHIVGQNGLMELVPFTNAHLSGRYAYDARPDSQLTTDAASVRKEFTDFINFFAKSGFLNMANATRAGALLWGQDPALMIQNPPPPAPPPPDPVSISMAFKAADLGIPEVRQVLQERGLQLGPDVSPELQAEMLREAERAAKPQHGGAANQVDKVDKHSSEQTMNQPGPAPLAGQPVQILPPGQRVQ